MNCFERITGLKMSMEKSKVASLNMSDEEVNMITQQLGCKQESWPLKYLGLPLGGNPKSIEFWS